MSDETLEQVVDLLLQLRSNPPKFSGDPEGNFDARAYQKNGPTGVGPFS